MEHNTTFLNNGLMAKATHSSNLKWKFQLITRNGESFKVETYWSSCNGRFWKFFVSISRGSFSETTEVDTTCSIQSSSDLMLKMNIIDAKLHSKGENLKLSESESTTFLKDVQDLAMVSFPSLTPKQAYTRFFL